MQRAMGNGACMIYNVALATNRSAWVNLPHTRHDRLLGQNVNAVQIFLIEGD